MTDVTALLERPQRAGVIRTVLDNNPGMDEHVAARIVDEAVKLACAGSTPWPVPCSPILPDHPRLRVEHCGPTCRA